MSLEIDYRTRKLTKEEIAHRDHLALMGKKVCCKCRLELPFASFSMSKSARDGLAPQCKECVARYYQRAKELYIFASADFSALREAAKKRGIPFELTMDGLRNWWGATPEVCVYCRQGAEEVGRLMGLVMENPGRNRFLENLSARVRFAYKGNRPIRRLTIDRKDNEAGYTLDNIQKACYICNYLKGSVLTDEEMNYLAPRLWERIRASCEVT